MFAKLRAGHEAPQPLLLELNFLPGTEPLEREASSPLPLPNTPAPPAPSPISEQTASENFADRAKDAAAHENVNALATPALLYETLARKEQSLSVQPASYAPALAPARLPFAQKEQQRFERLTAKLTAKPLFIAQKDTSLNFEMGDQLITATIRHQRATHATGIDEAEITFSTTKHGQQWQTRMRMKRLAFSHFAQFVDEWDPRVAVHDDQLDGRFHTNTGFTISSSKGVRPKFQGKVTTAAFEVRQSERWGVSNDKEIFQAGLETGTREIRMPEQREIFFQSINLPDSLCHRFAEETWLTFHAGGSYSWRTATQPETQIRRLPRQPFLIHGGRKAALHVRGVVSGKVLVQSEKRIIIDDDLTYARASELFADAEDYLGLVCRGDIMIAPPQSTGPGDLHLHAAIWAGGKFEVTHLYSDAKATLHIFGSLSAGSLSATEPRYATHIRFDKRLEQRRPPYFPMTERYEISDWQPEWKMVLP